MTRLIIHKTAQEFLDSNYRYLMQDELGNNLTMGVSLGIDNKYDEIPGYYFLSVVNGTHTHAVSIITNPRIIVSGDHRSDTAAKLLSEFYNELNIPVNGLIGEKFIAKKIADRVDLKQTGKRDLRVHELDRINKLTKSKGRLEQVVAADIKLITSYRVLFDIETKGKSVLSHDDILKDCMSKIEKGNLFKWTVEGRIVSIAAIMRVTKNIGIIGLVFTPEEMRGKGFATAIVLTLSEEIINRGFTKCGLFTDTLNPASNHIYSKIGYKPKLDFTDIYLTKKK